MKLNDDRDVETEFQRFGYDHFLIYHPRLSNHQFTPILISSDHNEISTLAIKAFNSFELSKPAFRNPQKTSKSRRKIFHQREQCSIANLTSLANS